MEWKSIIASIETYYIVVIHLGDKGSAEVCKVVTFPVHKGLLRRYVAVVDPSYLESTLLVVRVDSLVLLVDGQHQ